ncbi:hypothetical protein EDD15DRAFT_308663 [Pisolithus albus]|nr:hypothetical protein EDD15DRAFT_308663 [Pisolithus albus]
MKRWLQDTKGVQPWKKRMSRTVCMALLTFDLRIAIKECCDVTTGMGKHRVFSGRFSCAIRPTRRSCRACIIQMHTQAPPLHLTKPINIIVCECAAGEDECNRNYTDIYVFSAARAVDCLESVRAPDPVVPKVAIYGPFPITTTPLPLFPRVTGSIPKFGLGEKTMWSGNNPLRARTPSDPENQCCTSSGCSIGRDTDNLGNVEDEREDEIGE